MILKFRLPIENEQVSITGFLLVHFLSSILVPNLVNTF